jgi:hypothetical protein
MKKTKKLEQKQTDEEKPKPEAKFKSGAIQCTVWRQEVETEDGKKFDNYNFTIDRSYKDKNDEWKHTSSFRKRDTTNVIAVLNRVVDYLFIDEDSEDEE